MSKVSGKSKAQDALAGEIASFYPYSTVLQEVYIGKLVESQGYSVKEISKELGHKPHKMFVDIVIQDSERLVACEYHGEQHYHTVGNMTATTADVLMNQQLDEEKAWILQRVGIPIVSVSYDTYIDESVLDEMISEAYQETDDFLSSYYVCDDCGRRFPSSQMTLGVCASCRGKRATEVEAYAEEVNSTERRHKADDEWKAKQKERNRQKRKEAYRKWKESPEYLAQKERQKQERKRRNAEAREKRKAERRKNRE